MSPSRKANLKPFSPPPTSLSAFSNARNTEEWGANEEIFAAASDGDLPRLEDLVSRGANIDVKVGGRLLEVYK